jgi:hypothetical protein
LARLNAEVGARKVLAALDAENERHAAALRDLGERALLARTSATKRALLLVVEREERRHRKAVAKLETKAAAVEIALKAARD